MKEIFLIAVLAIALLGPAVHQALGATWAKTYGGTAEDDIFRGVVQAIDGDGHVIAGVTASFGAGSQDGWLTRTASNGTILWQKAYGGSGTESIRSITPVANGYVLAGATNSQGAGGNDVWLFKVNATGNILWQKAYGSSRAEYAHAVDATSDGGYLVAGYAVINGNLKDFLAMKVDANGTRLWQKTYGGMADDVVRTAKELSDGTYLIAGFTKSFTDPDGDIMVLRLNATNGNVIWQKIYGGAKFEEPSTILEVSDGIIIMEESKSFTPTTDGWMFKVDLSGNIIWQKTHGMANYDELSSAVLVDNDTAFVTAGEIRVNGMTPEDFWIAKFNVTDGSNIWQKRHGGSDIDEAESIALGNNGTLIVVGHTLSFGAGDYDIWVTMLDSAGQITGSCTGLTSQNVTTTAATHTSTATPTTITNTVTSPTFSTATTTATVTNTAGSVSVNTQCS